LRGEAAENIPVTELKLSTRQIDWRQLQRWHINGALVPPGTRAWFRDPSIWELYKSHIIITALILVLETVFVGVLLLQRAKRRRAEKELTKRQVELLASYEQIRDLGGRLLNAQDAERSRIARDLHDDVTQALSLLTLDLKLLSASRKPLEDVPRLVATADDITTTVRNLSHGLHPSQLRMVGLESSLKKLQHQ
jgi:signal transduction histidine kinase